MGRTQVVPIKGFFHSQGKFDVTKGSWSLAIEDRVIIGHYGSSNDYYIPFSSIDYIHVAE